MRRRWAAAGALGMLLVGVRESVAVQLPPGSASAFIQTSGPTAALTIGDFYTSANGANDPLGHRVVVNVPCGWPSATTVTVALFDPESQTPDPVSPTAVDEIRNTADNTSFTLYAPGGTVVGPVTYTPGGGTNGLWVELVTFTPGTAGFGCGAYALRMTTATDDDNAWRLQVSHDPDCTATPGTCSTIGAPASALLSSGNEQDDVDGLSATGDELSLGIDQTTFQHAVASCQDFFFFVSGALTPITLNNFDMDGNTSVTYFPPTGSSLAPSQSGTVSANGLWNTATPPAPAGPPPTRVGDSFAVGPDDAGWWRATVCVSPNNQYIFEAIQGSTKYYVQPSTPVMTVGNSDGVTSTTVGATLTYTLPFANTSNATATPGAAVDVTLTDTLPTNASFVGCTVNAPYTGSCVEGPVGTVTASVDQMVIAGASGTVTLSVQVTGVGSGSVVNAVTLDYQDLAANQYPSVTASDTDGVVTPTPTATPTVTVTATATATTSPTLTATETPTATATATETATPTDTPTPTVTSTPVATLTPVPTETPTETPTVTATATLTATVTPTATATTTSASTATSTPTPTGTPTPTSTATVTPVPNVTATGTPGPVATPPSGNVGIVLVQPATTLVMPFDVTTERATFQVVSHLGTGATLATHWTYWAEDCRHLVDVFVCLTPNDTKVMDVTAIQGEVQIGQTNHGLGPVADLSGERGITIVTAYDADPGAETCRPRAPIAASAVAALAGSWTIGDVAAGAAAGGNAIGLDPAAPPLPLATGALVVPTYAPATLQRSAVILMGLQAASGSGEFTDSEPGPIAAPMVGGAHVCCDARYIDNLESAVSLPDVCLRCVGFQPISSAPATGADVPLIPETVPVETSGMVELRSCRSAGADGLAVALGTDRPQWLFAFHLQMVGPFGTSLMGSYDP